MKKLTEFQKFIIIEALKRYNDEIEKEEFRKNSIITKEYIQYEIAQATSTLSKKTK